jgi:hypothetical protein
MNKRVITGLAVSLWMVAPGCLAADEELRDLVKQLSEQVSRLQQQTERANDRIRDLEGKLRQSELREPAPAKPAVAAAPAKPEPKPPVSAGDTPGTYRIPGTNTSLGFGGYVKLDANFSSVSAGHDRLGDQLFVAAQIPVDKNRRGEHGQTTFHAKESRFWIKSFTPSDFGNIDTFLEIDLFGAPETFNYTPRLRHAYGSIGPFLAGQTWTTFLNVSAAPDTLDPLGPVGATFYLRQPLIRWSQPFSIAGQPLELHVAAESPSSRLWDPATPDQFTIPNADRYPDLVARLSATGTWGNVSLAGLARHIRHNRPGKSETEVQWGSAANVSGRIDTWGRDNFRFMLGYGDANGRYAALNAFEDAALDPNDRMQLVTTYSAMAAYQHWWDKNWRSTVAYGYAASDQPGFVTGNMTRHLESAHFNLLWSPTLQTTFGLEYIYGLRERVDGRTGDLHRVQLSTRFNF